jgi:hypothetical protein
MPIMLGNGTMVSIGQYVRLSTKAQDRGIGPRGNMVQLYEMHPDADDTIGLFSDSPIPGWGDLDGEVDDGHGWYVGIRDLDWIIEISEGKPKIISHNFEFNGVQLKGMDCKFLSILENTKENLAFVEFNEDIGGCSADGLGKRGHCVAVPRKIIKDRSK